MDLATHYGFCSSCTGTSRTSGIHATPKIRLLRNAYCAFHLPFILANAVIKHKTQRFFIKSQCKNMEAKYEGWKKNGKNSTETKIHFKEKIQFPKMKKIAHEGIHGHRQMDTDTDVHAHADARRRTHTHTHIHLRIKVVQKRKGKNTKRLQKGILVLQVERAVVYRSRSNPAVSINGYCYHYRCTKIAQIWWG